MKFQVEFNSQPSTVNGMCKKLALVLVSEMLTQLNKLESKDLSDLQFWGEVEYELNKLDMTLKIKIQIAYHETKQWILYIVGRMWLVGVVQKWNKLWIRKNEFDKTLDMDSEMLMHMNKDEREKYMIDLVRRRNIVHERDMD